jgi:hypothetical protein
MVEILDSSKPYTVKDLINKLKEFDENLIVEIVLDGCGGFFYDGYSSFEEKDEILVMKCDG